MLVFTSICENKHNLAIWSHYTCFWRRTIYACISPYCRLISAHLFFPSELYQSRDSGFPYVWCSTSILVPFKIPLDSGLEPRVYPVFENKNGLRLFPDLSSLFEKGHGESRETMGEMPGCHPLSAGGRMDVKQEGVFDKSSKTKISEGPGAGLGAALVTLVAVLCCSGVPALLSFVGAIGLGVLIKKHLLFPLMVGSLLIGTWGAFRSYRLHRSLLILSGYIVSALALPIGMKVYHPLMYAGLVGILLVTGSDLVRKLRKPSICLPNEVSDTPGKKGC